MTKNITTSQLAKFTETFKEIPYLTDTLDTQIYSKDWCQEYQGCTPLVVFPRTTEEVQKIIKFCNQENLKVIPSGGRTGLSGGATALSNEIIISLEKMNKILEVNKEGRFIRCEAGVTLQQAQETALNNNFFLPLDLPSKGTSQIGGNIATNAGGIRVVRWGNTRELVLGITVVTGSGEILDLDSSLIKNNTGYDLKSLFIASEGTLGIITSATIKLTNKPKQTTRIFCGTDSLEKVIECFTKIRDEFSNLCAFEYLDSVSLNKVIEHKNIKNPLTSKFENYFLIEIEVEDSTKQDKVEEFIGELIESELILDAVCSQSEKQANELMTIRESIPEVLGSHYSIHKNDISLPIDKITTFIKELKVLLNSYYKKENAVNNEINLELYTIFGHIGDGNLHVNFIKPPKMSKEYFYSESKRADLGMFELIKKYKGSVSAEHGVGVLKKPYLQYTRSAVEIDYMRQIKKIFDPNSILNVGKIFDGSQASVPAGK